eukprot:1159035-Pelagomonas_calceolata.AAC.7
MRCHEKGVSIRKGAARQPVLVQMTMPSHRMCLPQNEVLIMKLSKHQPRNGHSPKLPPKHTCMLEQEQGAFTAFD